MLVKATLRYVVSVIGDLQSVTMQHIVWRAFLVLFGTTLMKVHFVRLNFICHAFSNCSWFPCGRLVDYLILIFNPLETFTVICKDFRLQVGRLKLVLLKIGTFLQSWHISPVFGHLPRVKKQLDELCQDLAASSSAAVLR